MPYWQRRIQANILNALGGRQIFGTGTGRKHQVRLDPAISDRLVRPARTFAPAEKVTKMIHKMEYGICA
jgi:hypothetical protein